VQANVGGAGFYRVELDAELRFALLDHGDPGALERFVLLDDTWAGVLAGRVPLVEGAQLVERLAAAEQDPSVWRRLAGAARELSRLAGVEHRDRTAGWIRGRSLPALERVDALLEHGDDDSEGCREVRGVLFVLAGADGADPSIRARARELLDDDSVDASLRAAAVSVVAASASADEHADLERRWRAAGTPQEELRFLNALVDTSDPALFDRTLELAATEVRTQNAPYLLRRAIDHPTLGHQAWDLISARWDELSERFPSNSLPRMLEGIRGVTDPALAARIQEFLAAHPTPSGARQVDQHLERMGVTVAAAARARAELERSPGMLGNGPS
jgi:puromycin-sensitive aminopeptidase